MSAIKKKQTRDLKLYARKHTRTLSLYYSLMCGIQQHTTTSKLTRISQCTNVFISGGKTKKNVLKRVYRDEHLFLLFYTQAAAAAAVSSC